MPTSTAPRTTIDTDPNNKNKTSGSSPQSPQTVRHHLYYRESRDVYILIGHVYFRLPSTDFPRSFFERFAGSKGLGPTIDTWPGIGAPENAILMTENETTPEEFAKLAWVLHNPLIDDFSTATLDDWLVISRLAHRWGFDTVSAIAIRRIKEAEKDTPDMSPVERVYKYELTSPPAELVEDLYVKICTRDNALSDAEWDQLDSLGGNQGRRVHRAREALLKARVRGRLDPEQKQSIVCKFLGLNTRRTIGSPPSTPSPTAAGPQAHDGQGPTTPSSSTNGPQQNATTNIPTSKTSTNGTSATAKTTQNTQDNTSAAQQEGKGKGQASPSASSGKDST